MVFLRILFSETQVIVGELHILIVMDEHPSLVINDILQRRLQRGIPLLLVGGQEIDHDEDEVFSMISQNLQLDLLLLIIL